MGQWNEASLRNTWVGTLVHLQLWVINQSGGLHRIAEFIHHSYQLVKWFSRTDVDRTKLRECLGWGWGGVQLCEPNRGKLVGSETGKKNVVQLLLGQKHHWLSLSVHFIQWHSHLMEQPFARVIVFDTLSLLAVCFATTGVQKQQGVRCSAL